MISASGQSTLLETGEREDLLNNANAKIRCGEFFAIFVDLCCEKDSVLSQSVVPGVLAIRLTKESDLSLKQTRRALHGVIREAYLVGCATSVWASTPCTAGCPWQRLNAAIGASCGDVEFSNRLIHAAIAICRHAARYGG